MLLQLKCCYAFNVYLQEILVKQYFNFLMELEIYYYILFYVFHAIVLTIIVNQR